MDTGEKTRSGSVRPPRRTDADHDVASGLRAQVLPVTVRRPSAVSQALKALREDLEGEPEAKKVPEKRATASGFGICVASNQAARERAFKLAHKVYSRSGYLDPQKVSSCIAAYDARPDTLILLARDAQGRDLATLSVVMDAPAGLPCDEIYHQEVQALRGQGCRPAEFARLAMDEGLEDPKTVLQQLFSFGYIFARHMGKANALLIEVNPRHALYYRRMLLFEPAGSARPCPRVNGAPAVLMRMECSRIEAVVGAGYIAGRGPGGDRFHPYFSQEEEQRCLAFLRQQHQPMTAEERQYFGLLEAGSGENTKGLTPALAYEAAAPR